MTKGPQHSITRTSADGCAVQIGLPAFIEEITTAIMERPRDGSPPMLAISADVVLAVAVFAQTLSREIVETEMPDSMKHWKTFAARGPIVEGEGAADACGSVVHPIHVSAVGWNAAQSGALLEDAQRERLNEEAL